MNTECRAITNKPNLRQLGDDVFRDPVREVFLIGVVADVVEWQDGDGRLVGQGRWPAPIRLGRTIDISADAERPNRLTDILDPLRPQVVEVHLDFRDDLLMDTAGNDHGTGLRQPLQTRGDVHAIAEDIVVLNDNIAEIDANSELDAAGLWRFRVSRRHAILKRHGAPDGIHHAGELGQEPIPRRLDNPSSVLGDAGLDQLAKVGGERGQRAFLVLTHQPRVTRNVGGEDGGEAALNRIGHRGLRGARWRVKFYVLETKESISGKRRNCFVYGSRLNNSSRIRRVGQKTLLSREYQIDEVWRNHIDAVSVI